MVVSNRKPGKVSEKDKNALVAISLASVMVITFLAWLIYFKEAADRGTLEWISYLPAVNAILNALCTICLIRGFLLIRKGRKIEHRNVATPPTAITKIPDLCASKLSIPVPSPTTAKTIAIPSAPPIL